VDVIAEKHGKDWTMYHADCVDVLPELPAESAHLSVYSPPFASLYTYSASDRDMGNCQSLEEFAEHFAFLLPEMLRITKPGRIMCIHCMDLPTSKARDGVIGLTDFPGELTRAAKSAGWIYHSKVTIWKDPVTAMQRTKALGLLYKQLRKDSCMSRQGIADYVLVLRAPGENAEPVTQTMEGFPLDQWQEWASPVWNDINQSDTLQRTSAREDKDERHICLASGSLVLTRGRGYVEIETVEPGEMVLTHRGRWMPVLAKQCNGERETVRVCAQGVADLVSTPDHKLYARVGHGSHVKKTARAAQSEWVASGDSLGAYLNMKLPPTEPSVLTEREWWIVGRWLGDGHRGTRRTSGARGAGFGEFIISCAHDEAEALAEKLGPHCGQRVKRTATQITLAGLRHEVRETLNRCGSGAANKRLPGEAVALCKEKAEALLSGYLSADGHYVAKYDRCCASSVSRALLLGIGMVAMRARGAVASVYAGRPSRTGEICGRTVNMKQDWVLTFRNSEGRAMSGWIDERGSWRKVRRVEQHGTETVWDLKVAEDESFTAEGCIVHNCPLQLEVIRRCVRLWSNRGDVVLSPFAGIGSEGYVSVQEGRRFIGVELKASYYDQACLNLADVDDGGKQRSMFGGAA